MTFSHPGLLYGSESDFLDVVVPFVRTAVAAGNPVLVAVPAGNRGLLAAALGDDRVAFSDMSDLGLNPGRIIPSVLLPFADAHPGRRVSIVGEPVWPGRTPAECDACATHEALVNKAFAGRDASILCPYDTSRLDPSTLDDAWRTHPSMIEKGTELPSPSYGEPVERPLPPPPANAPALSYALVADLRQLRDFVRAQATGVLPAQRVRELVLAAHELAANTVRHAGGPGLIRVWRSPGALECQVDDRGHIADPLAGRVPPPPVQQTGRGLLLVHQLCDLVRVRSGPAGTSIRLTMAVAAAR